MRLQNLGSFLASSILTHKCDWILALFKPFISELVINSPAGARPQSLALAEFNNDAVLVPDVWWGKP
jgi:hypothetical protein